MNIHYLQKRAAQFRLDNGIGTCEPIRLRSWLLKLNVLTIFKPMSEKFCGMAYKEGNSRFILVNSNHSIGKQHFTIGHELYHHFVQEDFKSMSCTTGFFNKKDKTEYDADWFSAFLLLPEDCLLNLIPSNELSKNKLTLPTIVKIEQYFACSRRAVLHRLDNMDLINYSNYEKYTIGVKNSAISLGYDKKLYESGNDGLVIGDYGQRVKKLFENEVISESHYFSLFNDIGIDVENELQDNEDKII